MIVVMQIYLIILISSIVVICIVTGLNIILKIILLYMKLLELVMAEKPTME